MITDNNSVKYKTLLITHSARNLGFVFDEHITLTKSLHCLNLVILTFVNFPASVLILILKQLVPSPPPLFTLSLFTATPSYFNLPKSQINRLQLIHSSLARVVFKAPKSCHISPVLKSLHWLKIDERIEYKLLSLTYNVLTTSQPSYLHNLISLQPPRCTCTSSVVTLARPQASSSLKITNRSFRHVSPHLWNKLPVSLRQPCLNQSSSPSSSSLSPLSSSITVADPGGAGVHAPPSWRPEKIFLPVY